ncbi:hypothetical protein AAFF_G00250920 [Aldrovandia affinis]|uniref:Uncharacterized protein n=1 Tax=Aldrovandia affinis TaxID=143900 RepID=A0AAD7RD32_9TELE|nr:hypothetical protein AAFF_G00250920 [Aldrovandia affinis]
MTLSWKVPMLVMAGLCSVATCFFVLFFHTDYRRLQAEADAMMARAGAGAGAGAGGSLNAKDVGEVEQDG